MVMTFHACVCLGLFDKPKIHHLLTQYKVIPTVEAKWEDMAYALKFEHPTVSAIERNKSDTRGRCIDMFSRWLDGEGEREPRTWGTLLEALEEIGNSELATEICCKLCKK